MTANVQRTFVLTLLVLLMVGTRINHFAPIPDASWAVFFIGGFYLRSWTRWAFPLLMALAVAVDWAVISGQGMDFWAHYCVSAGYWALVPAYFAMWAGGMLLRRAYTGASWRALGLFAATLVGAVVLCHLFAQGGFYWTSEVVAEPTVAGWFKNYTDWLLPYMRTAALYTGLGRWRRSPPRRSRASRPPTASRTERPRAMGNRLSKIYTRTGDDGSTGLGDGSRTGKDSLRVNAYGTVDEANSAIGVLLAVALPDDVRALLTTIQHQLFDLGGELCIPGHAAIQAADIDALERHLDRYNDDLPPLKDFILPAGGEAAARCHLARTIVRRAEREAVALSRVEAVRGEAVRYLNRLSDLLFVLARVLARADGHGEVLWNHERRHG